MNSLKGNGDSEQEGLALFNLAFAKEKDSKTSKKLLNMNAVKFKLY